MFLIAKLNMFPGHNILHVDFLFEDDDSTSRKNNMWIYWVDFEQEEGGAVSRSFKLKQGILKGEV